MGLRSAQPSEISFFWKRFACPQQRVPYRQRPKMLRDPLARQGKFKPATDQIRDNRALERLLEMAEVIDTPSEGKKPPKKTLNTNCQQPIV